MEKGYSLFDGPPRPFCDLDEILRSCPNPTPLPDIFQYYPFPGMKVPQSLVQEEVPESLVQDDHEHDEEYYVGFDLSALDEELDKSMTKKLQIVPSEDDHVSKETESEVKEVEEKQESASGAVLYHSDNEAESVDASVEDLDTQRGLKKEREKEGKHKKKLGKGRNSKKRDKEKRSDVRSSTLKHNMYL